MHCRAEQVGVGRSLASRDKFLKFVGTIKKTKKKAEQRERTCCGIRLQFTHYTIWPRNGPKTDS